MNIFAGKSPAERNKIIAASVLGIMALFALYMAFGGSIFSRKTSGHGQRFAVAVAVGGNPRHDHFASDRSRSAGNSQRFYDHADQLHARCIRRTRFPGRNIFAFYEPPPPTPYSPTPVPTEKPVIYIPPTPTPTPPIFITNINPPSVYAGSKTFRLQLSGERFTPDSKILFGGTVLPTVFVSENMIYADVPANLISGEGPRDIRISTPDSALYSNQFLLTVQSPPRPQIQYLGLIARKRYNNDTAYLQEQGKDEPITARLNDVIGRFKLISISVKEVVFEDTELRFRHRVPLIEESNTGTGTGRSNSGGTTYTPSYAPPIPNPNNPNNPNPNNPNPNIINPPQNISRHSE